MNLYEKEDGIDFNECVLQWWKDSPYDLLKTIALTYCVVPATVASERELASAGDIISDNRNLLNPDNLNMMIFLHENKSL